MEFVVNAGIREKKGIFLITIYSSPFARYLLSEGINKISLEFDNENVVILPGEGKRITIERRREEHPLITLCVTKLLPEKVKQKILNAKTQLPIRAVIRDFITEEEVIKYNHRINRAEPQNWDITTPKEKLLKIACHISCFKQNGKRWYRFAVRHRIFEKIVKRGLKVGLCRTNGKFFIKNNPGGNKLSFYKNKDGHSMAYMQISPSFLTLEEIELFEKGRTAVSSEVFFCNKDFGLEITDFFYDEREKELGKALIKREIDIQIPEMGKREADILLPEINGQIEVTTIMPVKTEKNKNNAHGEGVHINARLCEGFVRVANNRINKFFVILHKNWMDYTWVKDTCEMIAPNVKVISTDFGDNWAEQVADVIMLEVKDDRAN